MYIKHKNGKVDLGSYAVRHSYDDCLWLVIVDKYSDNEILKLPHQIGKKEAWNIFKRAVALYEAGFLDGRKDKTEELKRVLNI